ncbi:Cgr1 [Halocaridina rubra]|uniref:Coiled-coil domain-containing protein 86 n=1 Tax=Halocaridina rubra TaxID=373956 RepID=A0AAN8WNX9_HALRR
MTCEDSHSFVVTDDKKAAVQHSSLQHSNQDQSFINAKGKPVSGRWWKPEKKRFTSIIKDQGLRSSWAAKMERKRELKDQLAMKRSLVEEKKRKKIELVERQKLNIIRREENAKKAEIVQVIKDSRKIKKMKRKQLRYIETRDTSLLKKA